MGSRLLKLIAVLAVFSVMFLPFSFAQKTTGDISGTVTDPSGAVVPGATINVTNLDTKSVHSSTTDGEGVFRVVNLDAGRYRMEITAKGFNTVKREEFGSMVGTVQTISDFPMTPQGMAAVLHNDNLVTRFTKEGAAYAATVSLEHDGDSVSGYRWAVGKGPPVRLTSGTLTRAEITTRRQRPIDLVVPLFKRLTGLDG